MSQIKISQLNLSYKGPYIFGNGYLFLDILGPTTQNFLEYSTLKVRNIVYVCFLTDDQTISLSNPLAICFNTS
jgi:hypothetical protein